MSAAPESITIAAVATGPARGGIGVVRLSGSGSVEAARRAAPTLPSSPVARHAYLLPFTDAAGAPIDEGVVLFFAAPASYTGEDVVELQAHGSPRVLQLLLDAVLRAPGVRMAEPGEFTRRAFLNGRLDLARAEAVAQLVAADSEAGVRAAAAQLAGALSEQLKAVRAPLVALRAQLEAALDFPEEAEGVEVEPGRLRSALAALRALKDSGRRGALIRRGARVVLYGPVNAGKSTLFNRLVGAERALVDEQPGTTRDALEASVEWEGLQVTLLDTAGLRAPAERLEARGIERTRQALKEADLAVLLLPPETREGEAAAWRSEVGGAPPLEVRSKADLFPGTEAGLAASGQSGVGAEAMRADFEVRSKAELRASAGSGLAVSGQSGAGVEELRAAILAALGYHRAEAVALSSARHLEALDRAVEALERAVLAQTSSTLEVVAGEVGAAVLALSEITGEDASAELVDEIFKRFCIGK